LNQTDYVKQILGDRLANTPAPDASAVAPANIALCKYWGKRDAELNLPVTDSLSISLGHLGAKTCLKLADEDQVILNGEVQDPQSSFARRALSFVDLFRPEQLKLELITESSIPVAAGLASSASGFAALVLALNELFQWKATVKESSLLARIGSGSACRSIEPGFVHWRAGSQADGLDSFAERLDTKWPDFRIGLLVLESGPKPIGSREAMIRTTETAELYRSWPAQVERDLASIRSGIEEQNVHQVGTAMEENALAMHATMIASRPPIIYWTPESVALIQKIQTLRKQGLDLYLTMDAGPNVKVIYLKSASADVKQTFPDLIEIAPFAPEN